MSSTPSDTVRVSCASMRTNRARKLFSGFILDLWLVVGRRGIRPQILERVFPIALVRRAFAHELEGLAVGVLAPERGHARRGHIRARHLAVRTLGIALRDAQALLATAIVGEPAGTHDGVRNSAGAQRI